MGPRRAAADRRKRGPPQEIVGGHHPYGGLEMGDGIHQVSTQGSAGGRGHPQQSAYFSGLHRTQVGAFETARMNITLSSLHLIAQTLGMQIVDLFTGVEDRPEPYSPAPDQASSAMVHGDGRNSGLPQRASHQSGIARHFDQEEFHRSNTASGRSSQPSSSREDPHEEPPGPAMERTNRAYGMVRVI